MVSALTTATTEASDAATALTAATTAESDRTAKADGLLTGFATSVGAKETLYNTAKGEFDTAYNAWWDKDVTTKNYVQTKGYYVECGSADCTVNNILKTNYDAYKTDLGMAALISARDTKLTAAGTAFVAWEDEAQGKVDATAMKTDSIQTALTSTKTTATSTKTTKDAAKTTATTNEQAAQTALTAAKTAQTNYAAALAAAKTALAPLADAKLIATHAWQAETDLKAAEEAKKAAAVAAQVSLLELKNTASGRNDKAQLKTALEAQLVANHQASLDEATKIRDKQTGLITAATAAKTAAEEAGRLAESACKGLMYETAQQAWKTWNAQQ